MFIKVKRNFTNPEEQVQAEAFLKLILVYGYPAERIQQFVSVTMGSSIKEADIIVYNDQAWREWTCNKIPDNKLSN